MPKDFQLSLSDPPRNELRRFAIHGLALELRCRMPELRAPIEQFLGDFAVPNWPDGFSPISGSVQPYDLSAIQRTLSPTATPIAPSDELMELYQDGERFWLIDDRWGMTELNLLKRQWKSWLLPRPSVDPLRCAEMGILWPLAQLLRGPGLHLTPAVSIARQGWAAILLCPFNIEPELSVLVRNGYRVIGQRWSALREEDGRIALLHMPGIVDRTAAPHLRCIGAEPAGQRLDLTADFPGSRQNHAFCDAVLIAQPGRRTKGNLRELPHTHAVNLLRHCWPIVDLQPDRHGNQLLPKLARHCRCVELQLSRDPLEVLHLLDDLRTRRRPPAIKPVSSPLQLSVFLKSPRRSTV